MMRNFKKSGDGNGKVFLGLGGAALLLFLLSRGGDSLGLGNGSSGGIARRLTVRVSSEGITVGNRSFADAESALAAARSSGARIFDLTVTGAAVQGVFEDMLTGLRGLGIVVIKS